MDVWEDDWMPVDQYGNRAELIMDGVSVVKRLNIGQLFEQYISASMQMMWRKIAAMYPKEGLDKTWKYLLGWYKIASPLMYNKIVHTLDTEARIRNHVECVVKEGLFVYLPPNSPNLGPGQVSATRDGLEKNYPLEYGPVTYRGRSGEYCTTVDSMIIGAKYMMLLDAIPDKWSSVATSKLQHFGMPALLTNQDKYSFPVREQPVKLYGEDEVRLLNATMGPDATSDLLDQSNSPGTHKNILENLYTAEYPTNLDEVVDREQVPRGKSRPLVYINHALSCGGISMKYSEYDHAED